MTVKNRKRKIFILLTMILINLGWPGWVRKTVGTYSDFCNVKIGDGRNDGVQRVYCGCSNGHVVEWSFNNYRNTWEMVDCGKVPSESDNGIISLWVGNGRGDGLNRVYSTCSDGNIYEFTYSDRAWEMKDLGSPGFLYTGITTGKARNDNRDRIYAGGYDLPVCEYTWDGSSWNKNDVSSEKRYIWPLAIAQGRNDGIERIYCPDWSASCLIEYTWNGSNYEEVIINSSKSLVKTVVGSGRNDGINRVYASGYFGHIYEFTYSSNGWEKMDIHPDATDLSRYGLCLGRTKIDGRIRLYSGANNGDISEHSWDGNSWSDSAVDAITGATAYLAVGEGRNDDTVRIYATNRNSQLYEFTNTSPFVKDSMSIINNPMIKANDNLYLIFSGNSISYSLLKSGNVRLVLYNLSGNEVCCLKDEFQSAGTYIINLPWKDKSKFKLPAGIYICGLKFMDSQKFLKIVQIK